MTDFAANHTTRVMSANLKGGRSPKGLHAGGPHLALAPAGERAVKAIRRGKRTGVTVWFFSEFTKLQADAIRAAFPELMIYRATPNDRFPGGVEIGNGFVVDPAVWWPTRDLSELLIEGQGETLHLPVILLEPRGWGGKGGWVTFIGVHWWAGRRLSIRLDRRKAAGIVQAKAETLERVVLLGDFQIAVRLFKKWRGFRAGVDAALVKGLRARNGRAHPGFDGTISDHPAVSLELTW